MGYGGVSSAQEAMWLEQNLAPEVPNSTTTIWDVRGELHLPDLEDALRTALGETSALLVNFRRESDELRIVPRKPDAWEPSALTRATPPTLRPRPGIFSPNRFAARSTSVRMRCSGSERSGWATGIICCA